MDTPEVRTPETLTMSQAWALVRASVVGRLAVVVDDHPDIFPINHVVDHGSVVFRTAEGSKLHGALGRPVAFEADGYDLETASAWSVVIKGRAREIRELEEATDALTLPLFPWHPTPKPRYLRIDPDTITGIRFPVVGGERAPAEEADTSSRPEEHP